MCYNERHLFHHVTRGSLRIQEIIQTISRVQDDQIYWHGKEIFWRATQILQRQKAARKGKKKPSRTGTVGFDLAPPRFYFP